MAHLPLCFPSLAIEESGLWIKAFAYIGISGYYFCTVDADQIRLRVFAQGSNNHLIEYH